jgi:hypothetical protein
MATWAVPGWRDARREYSLEDDLTFHHCAVYGLLSSDH